MFFGSPIAAEEAAKMVGGLPDLLKALSAFREASTAIGRCSRALFDSLIPSDTIIQPLQKASTTFSELPEATKALCTQLYEAQRKMHEPMFVDLKIKVMIGNRGLSKADLQSAYVLKRDLNLGRTNVSAATEALKSLWQTLDPEAAREMNKQAANRAIEICTKTQAHLCNQLTSIGCSTEDAKSLVAAMHTGIKPELMGGSLEELQNWAMGKIATARNTVYGSSHSIYDTSSYTRHQNPEDSDVEKEIPSAQKQDIEIDISTIMEICERPDLVTMLGNEQKSLSQVVSHLNLSASNTRD